MRYKKTCNLQIVEIHYINSKRISFLYKSSLKNKTTLSKDYLENEKEFSEYETIH